MPFPMSITVAIAATHVSLYIVRRSPAGPCRLEKTLSPAISSGRGQPAPMQIAAGPAIGSRCPLDHDRQQAFFFQSFFSTKNCARLRIFSTLNSFRRRRATSRHAPRSPGAACCSLGEHRRLGPDAVPARCRRTSRPVDEPAVPNRQRNGYARLRIFSPARHPA